MTIDRAVLVLGLGNRLLRDDAAGPLAIDELASEGPSSGDAVFRDGGTIGLALLPAIEDAGAVIALDAARLGAMPGTVQVFEGEAMDRQLGGRKRSAHEVALADLMAAAAFNGRLPRRRALVAVEPQSTELGLAPSAPVQRAIPQMCGAVRELLRRWQS
jgi:hydrogenase maturation protease